MICTEEIITIYKTAIATTTHDRFGQRVYEIDSLPKYTGNIGDKSPHYIGTLYYHCESYLIEQAIDDGEDPTSIIENAFKTAGKHYGIHFDEDTIKSCISMSKNIDAQLSDSNLSKLINIPTN